MNAREAKQIACSMIVSAIERILIEGWATGELMQRGLDVVVSARDEKDLERIETALTDLQQEMMRRSAPQQPLFPHEEAV